MMAKLRRCDKNGERGGAEWAPLPGFAEVEAAERYYQQQLSEEKRRQFVNDIGCVILAVAAVPREDGGFFRGPRIYQLPLYLWLSGELELRTIELS